MILCLPFDQSQGMVAWIGPKAGARSHWHAISILIFALKYSTSIQIIGKPWTIMEMKVALPMMR